jgi:phosphoribosylformylglycinamidine cyclo-ligase
VNDILVQGARPIFFLDYVALGAMDEGVVTDIVSGVAAGCRDNGCALLGGETAQMPDLYAEGEYDLAGFVVGVVERDRVLDGSAVRAKDVLVGIGSTGLHTNGYSLARKIVFDHLGLGPDDPFPGTGRSVADELLEAHRSYLRPMLPLLDDRKIHALAHITGGGIPGNLPRVLGSGLGAAIRRTSWKVPAVFAGMQKAGSVATEEMDRVFNMGVGMIAIVAPADADAVVASLRAAGEDAWILGEIEPGEGVRYV